MLSKSADLQNQINELDLLIQQGASDAQLNLWEIQRKELQGQLQVALAEEQAHESRIQEATAESNGFLGDIDIAGVPIAESGLSELAYNILNAKVQAKHVAAIEKLSLAMNEMQANHRTELNTALERAEASEYTAEKLNVLNNEQGVKIYKLETDNAELDNKVRKGSDQNAELTEIIEKLNKQIEDYKNTELLAPQKAVVLSTSEQVAQQEAQLKASRIKVTSMTVDPNDFSKTKWSVILASNGEKVEINYLQKGLYTVISEVEAEQLRADEANRVAEQALSIPASLEAVNVPELEAINVPVNEVNAENTPIETGHELDEGLLVDGSNASHEVAEKAEESEVIPFTRHHDSMLVGLEEMVKELTYRMDQHESKQAVA